MQYYIDFSLDYWPDAAYAFSTLIHIIQTFTFFAIDKRLIFIEVPRLLSTSWKLLVKLY